MPTTGRSVRRSPQPEGSQAQRETLERSRNADKHLPPPGLQSSGVTTSSSHQCCEITLGVLEVRDKDITTREYQLKMVCILNNFKE